MLVKVMDVTRVKKSCSCKDETGHNELEIMNTLGNLIEHNNKQCTYHIYS